MWKRIKKFWKAGLAEPLKDASMPSDSREEILSVPSGSQEEIPSVPFGNREETGEIRFIFLITAIVVFLITGCSSKLPEVSEPGETVADHETYSSRKDDIDDAERIAAVYRDIYEKAVKTPAGNSSMPESDPAGADSNQEGTDTSGSLETLRRIVAGLGEKGYVAVDSENQVDMAGAEKVVEFCKAADEKENARLTILVVMESGFRKIDLATEDGSVTIVSGFYQYDQNGCLQDEGTVSYPANWWEYTEEGYFIFEGSYYSDIDYVLTVSDTPEHTALRVMPLNETCREWNRKYLLPVGYEQNNLFLTDWNEEDFGDLDFYDIFDHFYPIMYGQPVSYTAEGYSGDGEVCQIPENVFENVIMEHFHIDRETLRSKTTCLPESAAYEYRPRGFYEVEYPDIPYPEVIDATKNPDGTITLLVNAVYPDENTSRAYSHRTVVRPLDGDHFQYVSNQMISSEEEYDIWWHSDRLPREEWLEIYGET